MPVIFARNDALDVNPQGGDARLSEAGSDWLWAVTAIYLVSFLAYFALSFKPRNNERIFHYLFTIALFVGTIAYFSMASGIAYSVIPTQLNLGRALSYQIYFAKYINWVVAFPIVLLALGLMSGVSWATILFNIFLAWIW
jgi:bacteriorhodopsin